MMRTSLLTKVYTNLWWLQTLLGLAFVGFGLWIAFIPRGGYSQLNIFFASAILLTGAFEMTRAVKNKDYSNHWLWYFLGGTIDVIVGLIFLANMEYDTQLEPYLLGSWIVFRGLLYLALSLDLKRIAPATWFTLFFFGILIIAMGILILARPELSSFTIIYATSFAFIITGIFRIVLGRSLYISKLH